MGKMSDLDLQIKELRSCGETILGNRRIRWRGCFLPTRRRIRRQRQSPKKS